MGSELSGRVTVFSKWSPTLASRSVLDQLSNVPVTYTSWASCGLRNQEKRCQRPFVVTRLPMTTICKSI